MVAKLTNLTNAYDFTFKKSKILNINFTQPAWTVTAYAILNIFFEFWISAEGARVEDNGNWGYQDHTKRFFFFPSRTPESSLGYKY